MRFHAWNFTQFTKIIYFDADLVPMTNIDDIFRLDAEMSASYCARPGVVDPCFNAGLLMFKPSAKTYSELMDMWKHLSKGGSCPNDQVLLWHYYADRDRWTPFPYAYNVRRHIYHPMKVYHFACCLTPKPWKVSQVPTREETLKFEGPIKKPWDMVIVWWRYFYQALDEFHLHSWYESVK